jgi:hypothetical protein
MSVIQKVHPVKSKNHREVVFCGLNWARTSDLSDVNRMF